MIMCQVGSRELPRSLGRLQQLSTLDCGPMTGGIILTMSLRKLSIQRQDWVWNSYLSFIICWFQVNLPLSIGIAIPMVTIIYVLVNISYLTVMSPGEMLVSDAVAVTFGNRILGPLAWLMPLSVAFSTFGAANGTIFAAGRLCYVASREGHLVDVLSFVHVKKMTPAPAVLFHAVVALGMVLSGSIEGLIDFFR